MVLCMKRARWRLSFASVMEHYSYNGGSNDGFLNIGGGSNYGSLNIGGGPRMRALDFFICKIRLKMVDCVSILFHRHQILSTVINL